MATKPQTRMAALQFILENAFRGRVYGCNEQYLYDACRNYPYEAWAIATRYNPTFYETYMKRVVEETMPLTGYSFVDIKGLIPALWDYDKLVITEKETYDRLNYCRIFQFDFTVKDVIIRGDIFLTSQDVRLRTTYPLAGVTSSGLHVPQFSVDSGRGYCDNKGELLSRTGPDLSIVFREIEIMTRAFIKHSNRLLDAYTLFYQQVRKIDSSQKFGVVWFFRFPNLLQSILQELSLITGVETKWRYELLNSLQSCIAANPTFGKNST